MEVERFSSLLESLSKATCLEGQLAGQIETRLDDSRVAQSSRSATAAVHRMSGSSNATRLSENVRKSKDGSTRNLLFPDGMALNFIALSISNGIAHAVVDKVVVASLKSK